MKITYTGLKRVAFLLLALPSVVFMLGFLRWYVGIPLALLIGLAYFFTVRDGKREGLAALEEKAIRIPLWCLWTMLGITVMWCYFGGLGNLYYQSSDWFARNAIFRDLISHKWPVVYGAKDVALVYYIGFWLPPALVGKGLLMLKVSLDTAFFVSNLVLWLWAVICVAVAMLCTMLFVKANTVKRFFALIAVFILFSGLDGVGTLYNLIVRGIAVGDHAEWWSNYYQYSSMTTALFWVFNQSVMAWLAVSCFINEESTRNYAFIVVMCAAAGPLPCVGLGVYMIGIALWKMAKAIKAHRMKDFWLDVFTPQNLIAALCIFPVYLLYYMTNLAVNVGQEAATVRQPMDLWAVLMLGLAFALLAFMAVFCHLKKREWKEWLSVALIVGVFFVMAIVNTSLRLPYVFFVLLEGVVFLLPMWREYKREPLWHLSLLLVMLCPTIHVGTAADFCMRASIPLVFVLMALCVRFLFSHTAELRAKLDKKDRRRLVTQICCWALILCLAIGVFTPYKEFERGVVQVVTHRKLALVDDWAHTFDQVFTGEMKNLDRNFIAPDYEKTLFYRYLAK